MTPLSHHEILAVVAPFARRGRQPDLARSERLERRLVFQPLQHAEAGLVETLQLENAEPGLWRLTRRLQHPAGVQATLVTEGGDAGMLLQRVESVPPSSQMLAGSGPLPTLLALSQRLVADRSGSLQTTLEHATLLVSGLRLAVRVPAVTGIAAEVEIGAVAGDLPWLPEDLLAVLGWHWSRLRSSQDGWRCTLLLRGTGPQRGVDAVLKLHAAARHLAQTLAEPPLRFHQRLLRRRWGVTLRRAVPALVCITLIACAAAVPQLELAQNSVFRMIIFNAPPLLMVLFFSLREMPQIEIPPLPRAPRQASWRQTAG